MTEKTIQKLEQAFSYGATDSEACIYAEISRASLYDYQRKNPDFLDKKNAWKEKPVLQARKTIIDALKSGDVKTACWYLERKKKDEFSTKVETAVYGDDKRPPVQVQAKPVTLEEAERAYNELIKSTKE